MIDPQLLMRAFLVGGSIILPIQCITKSSTGHEDLLLVMQEILSFSSPSDLVSSLMLLI